jgi:hypothetical protein
MITNFFSPLSFVTIFGSGIRDPRSGIRDPGSGIRDAGSGMGKNQDPGAGINIPDPPHCIEYIQFFWTRSNQMKTSVTINKK